jgi:hypothetical protein
MEVQGLLDFGERPKTTGRPQDLQAVFAGDSETEKKFLGPPIHTCRGPCIFFRSWAPNSCQIAVIPLQWRATSRSLSNRQDHVSGMHKTSALSSNRELVGPSRRRRPDLQGQD